MIVQHDGYWSAIHIPTAPAHPYPPGGVEKKFSSKLAAKCWLIVMDDRHGTRGWPLSCLVGFD